MHHILNCYIAEFFPPVARVLSGYVEVTWHLTIKLFPAKSLLAGNSAKSLTSEGNSALLPANVNRRPPVLLPLHVFLFVLYNKWLNDWSLGNSSFFSLESQCFPSAAPWGNIEILVGKHNELFPSGPVIKCLLRISNQTARITALLELT